MKEIGFCHGVFAESYEKQANDQGYTLGNNAELFNMIGLSYNALRMHGYLTDSQADSVCQKIQNGLMENIKPLAKENKRD